MYNRTVSRENKIVERISGYLQNSKRIIDVGAGRGIVTQLLRETGKEVVPVDVGDYRGGRRVTGVVIYDGIRLPFHNRKFDTGLLITVLHHTSNPSIVFSEVARVSRNIVVIETSYRNLLEKILTVFTDTLANLRLNLYWDSYKSDREWRNFFNNHGYIVASSQSHFDRVIGVPFLHLVYQLRRK